MSTLQGAGYVRRDDGGFDAFAEPVDLQKHTGGVVEPALLRFWRPSKRTSRISGVRGVHARGRVLRGASAARSVDADRTGRLLGLAKRRHPTRIVEHDYAGVPHRVLIASPYSERYDSD